jgi:hypothetical protein
MDEEPWWIGLLRELGAGVDELADAEAWVRIPIADSLIGRAIARRLPPEGPVRELAIMAHDGNEIAVRARLSRPAMLPPIEVRLRIEQQPALPDSPVLVLGIVSKGLARLAVSALRFVDVLPPGVGFDGRRFAIDLRALLERQGAAGALEYLADLKITTAERRVVVEARGAVPARR